MTHSFPSTPDTQALLHRIRMLELERDQQKLKAKRMAIHAAYLETLVKRAKGVNHD